MKITYSTILAILSLGMTSCADFFGTSDKDSDFKRGVAAGKAQFIRQQYWEAQNKPVETPALEKRYTPITVPEQTGPDGVIIDAHTEYVETVQ